MSLTANGKDISPRVVAADQVARQALTVVDGDLVYQADIQVTYQWRSDDGGPAEWRVVHLPATDDPTNGGGYASVVYWIDPAGDDLNDGRAITRPKATFASVFRELNDSGGVPDAFVQIIPSAGTYTETGYYDLRLNVPVPQGVYIIPAMASFLNNEPADLVTDNGLVAPSLVERDVTTLPFTTFAGRGQRFLWVPDGSLTGDNFPSMVGNAILPSTSPNLRICSTNAPFFTTAILSQYECKLEVYNLVSTDPETQLVLYGVAVDFSTGSLPTLQNILPRTCAFTNTGGASTLFLNKTATANQSWQGCYLNLPANVNVNNYSASMSTFGCDSENSAFKIFTGKFFWTGNILDGSIRWGGFPNSEAVGLSGSASGDFTTSGTPIVLYGGARVRQLSDIYAPNCLTTVVSVNEGSQYNRQIGNIIAANAALVGPAISVGSGSVVNLMAGNVGILTNPPGQDIRVGANATAALAALPANDYAAGATSLGCRAN